MITDETENATIQAAAEQPKPATKATAAPRRPRVAPSKAKSGKKATAPKKAAKTQKSAKKAGKAKPAGAREGSKTAQVVAMLQRKNGATLAEITAKAVAGLCTSYQLGFDEHLTNAGTPIARERGFPSDEV
jgi:hypothetical protein